MASENLEKILNDEWQAAEQALASARSMPGGPSRIAALREAGEMRFKVSERIRLFSEGLRRMRED